MAESKKIDYTLKISKRAKSLRIAVYCSGSVIVTAPRFFPEYRIHDFINKKSEWILEKVKKFSKLERYNLPKISKKEMLEYKKQAKILAEERVDYFNGFYNLRYKKINIKKQKTRWGSCSKKGNLNFNYKIIFLPKELSDYLIVHELCHLGELNHSKNFWKLVSKTIPDYKIFNQRLKNVIIR